jgi:predicted ribosome quality control (RQC) complex YloA/Tae2 family protein
VRQINLGMGSAHSVGAELFILRTKPQNAQTHSMQEQTIERLVDELRSILVGRFAGKTFQLSSLSLAIDFGLRTEGYLFINVDPAAPRLYLIKRRVRDLEQSSVSPLPFAHAMRTQVGGGKLVSVTKDDSERVVRFSFIVEDDLGEVKNLALVAQLTGRSANLFLLDEQQHITHALRTPQGQGQLVGEQYQPPASCGQKPALEAFAGAPPLGRDGQRSLSVILPQEALLNAGGFPSLSAAADDHYQRLELEQGFANRCKSIRDRLRKEVAQRTRLIANLKRDLALHGNPEQHKRVGDLLLANISGARREGHKVTVSDYYSEGVPAIEIEVDENTSLQDEAARYFARYTKAKRAREEIAARMVQVEGEISRLRKQQAQLEKMIASGDEAGLNVFDEPKTIAAKRSDKKAKAEKLAGIRRYLSSDGYEILVGRAAHTNDNLTFRVARPHDLWLHAADYPGSHVIVRNPTRGEIPHRTIIEAAQLAAKFSQAGDDSKVTVHYTQRKFLAKPKGVAPGLVRMSSFRTITVEPAEAIQRL